MAYVLFFITLIEKPSNEESDSIATYTMTIKGYKVDESR